MADLLKFKHGLQASMKANSPAITPGTVYITRDERAMYVDLPAYSNADGSVTEAAKRIRIGDMRVYTYLDELKADLQADMNSLTTSALYYAEKDNATDNNVINALLKWNGAEFIQLNKTSDIAANLSSLEDRIEDLEDLTAGHTTSIGANASAIEGLDGRLDILEGDADTEGSVAHSIAAAVATLNASIAKKADQTSLDALSKTVSDNAAAATTAHSGLQTAINNEKTRAEGEEERLAGLINTNTTNIGNNTSAIATLNGDDTVAGSVKKQVKDAVAAEAEARAAAITTVNGSISDINGEINTIKQKNDSQDAEIDKKVNIAQGSANSNKVMVTDASGNVTSGAAVAGKLQYLAKVSSDIQDQIDALDGAIDGSNDEIDGLKTRLSTAEGNISSNDTDIANLQSAVNTLNGADTVAGSVKKQIKDAVAAETAARVEAEGNLQAAIESNDTDIKNLQDDVDGLETQVSTFIETTAPATYLKKTDASSTYLTKTDASSTYATKDELSTAQSTLLGTSGDGATANTIHGAKAAAQAAQDKADAAQTTANSGVSKADAAQADIDAYQTSNDAAVAAIKATADAAATATALNEEIARATKAEQDNSDAIDAEATRAKGVEADHEERIAEMETFWAAADDPEGTIDKLAEIVNYIAADKEGALDMAADIQKNTGDISALAGRVTTAEGDIDKLQDDLAAEITNRGTAVSGAITSANAYTDTALAWGTF